MKSPASSLDVIPGLSCYRVLTRIEKICSVSRLCSVPVKDAVFLTWLPV